jgi:Tfp pilus assembly protein PilO
MPANSNVAKSRHLLITGGYAALGVAFVLVGVLPFVRGVSAAKGAIAEYKHEIEKRVETKSALTSINKEIHDLEYQVRNYERLVPPNQDLGNFLKQVSEQLDKHGMKEVDIHAQAAITREKSQKLPITIHASGSFVQLQKFLLSLENLPRMCSVGQVILENADPTMNGKVKVNLTLFIYNSKPS